MKRFRVAAVPLLQSLRLRGRLADGRLAFSDLDIGWAGGHSTGTAALDLRAQPAALGSAARDARRPSRGAVSEQRCEPSRHRHAARQERLEGGRSDAEAVRASLSGSVSAQVSAGTIPSLLDAQMGLAVGKMLKSYIGGGNEPLPLPCAAVHAELGGGLARIRSLVVDSANTRTTGSGVVDLRDGSIDLMLTPEPKRPGLLELKKSIRLSGKPPNLDKSLVERRRAAQGDRLRRRQALSARSAAHQRALAEQALDQVDRDLGGAVAHVERRVELHHVERGEPRRCRRSSPCTAAPRGRSGRP